MPSQNATTGLGWGFLIKAALMKKPTILKILCTLIGILHTPLVAFDIREIVYAPGADEVTLTWNSSPGETYSVSYSLDLTNWLGNVSAGILPDEGDTTTVTFDLTDTGIDAEEVVFFRVEKESDETTPGLNSLYMGHSYFRRQADAMNEYAEIAGIEGHETTSLFWGGVNGSAAAIWDNISAPNSRQTIQDHLDEGDIEMFGMTIFIDPAAAEDDVRHVDNQTQGLKNWIEYASAKNPDTIFFVALPWLGRPLDYVGDTGDPQTSGHEAYRERILESETGITVLIDELRDTFPNSEIFLLAYGQGSAELRTLYNNGNLPDVDTLVSNNGHLGIHKDSHGHAEQLLTDLNTLIWLESIYGYNVLEFEKDYTYTTDIRQIAHDVVSRQDPDYTRRFQ